MAHINQPGGPFQASEHPAVAGRELELRALADAVRRLCDATVTNTAPPAETAAFTAEVNAIAERLEAHVPDVPPPRYGPKEKHVGPPITHVRAPFDLFTGICNPRSLPVEMELDTDTDPPVSRGRAVFTTGFEGPPGCVHGGIIAASFDMVFTAACSAYEAAGPTISLSVRFRRPTLLNTEAVFEGQVDRLEGNRTYTVGRLLQGGEVTVEAEGVFKQLDIEGIHALQNQTSDT